VRDGATSRDVTPLVVKVSFETPLVTPWTLGRVYKRLTMTQVTFRQMCQKMAR